MRVGFKAVRSRVKSRVKKKRPPIKAVRSVVTEVGFKAVDLQIQHDNEILLRDINIKLNEGTTVSISGKIGCGKTSLLHVLGLLAKPKIGSIYIGDSVDCAVLPRAEIDVFINHYFAYVFQETVLMEQWTAIENISLPLIARGYTKEKREAIAREYCEKLEIKKYAEKSVLTLSSGTRRLVSIARALAKEPKILIADEPVLSLDDDTREKSAEFLADIAKEKKMIMIAATHLEAAKKHLDKWYEINGGGLVRKK
jgi:ABC-type lipoprotein export system ATPase subunit